MAFVHPKVQPAEDSKVESVLTNLLGLGSSSFWRRVAWPIVEIFVDSREALGFADEDATAEIVEERLAEWNLCAASREDLVSYHEVHGILGNARQTSWSNGLEEVQKKPAKEQEMEQVAPLWLASMPSAATILSNALFPLHRLASPLDPAAHLISLCSLTPSTQVLFLIVGVSLIISSLQIGSMNREEVSARSMHSTAAASLAITACTCAFTAAMPASVSLHLTASLGGTDIEYIIHIFEESLAWSLQALVVGKLAGRTEGKLVPLLVSNGFAAILSGFAFANASVAQLHSVLSLDALAMSFGAACFKLVAMVQLTELCDHADEISAESKYYVRLATSCLVTVWTVSSAMHLPLTLGIITPQVAGPLMVLLSCTGQLVVSHVALWSPQAVVNSQQFIIAEARQIRIPLALRPQRRLAPSQPPQLTTFTGQRFRLVGCQSGEIVAADSDSEIVAVESDSESDDNTRPESW